MKSTNQTSVSEFILLGLTRDPKMQVPLFIIFLIVYIITVLDNVGIICICYFDRHLHTPMYFFISNLAFVDLCYSTILTPKMLMGFLVEWNVISVSGCATQLFFFTIFGIAECLIISFMAFDRYIAICKPLHYTVIMTQGLCNLLASVPYGWGIIAASVYLIFTVKLSFCGDNKIPHFFCDLLPLFKLSCVDTSAKEMILYITSAILGGCNVIALSLSYTCIIITILKIRSSAGRRKIFSTCSSHLICVAIFYSTSLTMYLRPNSRQLSEKDKVVSMFYTIIISMLNPLIYSLRNKDVKAAVRRILTNQRHSQEE